MKPKAALRHFLALAGSSLLTISSVSAAPFTWTQTATGSQTWGTAGNWLGGTASDIFVSGAGNELIFFADTTASIGTTSLQTIISVPSTLSMNTLTLNGRGPNNTLGFPIIIGDNTSTWTIGDGTTSTINLNSTLGGGTADRDMRYTVGANLTLNQTTTTFTGNSTSITGATFSGNITQAAAGYGITKSGSSLLILSGNNSYSGTTLVTGGTLRLSSATALSGGTGTTGGTSALTMNGGVVELGATDFSRDLGTGSSQFQITDGTSGFSARDGNRIITVNGDASQELVWGVANFAPTTLVLNAATANNSLELANKIDLSGATRTIEVNANKAFLSNDIRTSSGTAGLTKTGNGTLVLTGNNTYNGDTTISGGTLSVAESSNFGSGSSGLILNTASLQIRGTALTSLSGLGHAVTINNGNKGFDIHDVNNTFTVDQALNNGTLIKSGVGTLVLNQDNNLTGATTATGGGTLVLDYTTNNGSKLRDASGLTLNGSALVLKGGSHNEVISSTAIANYTSNRISRDGGTSTISLGAISTSNNFNQGWTLAISEANLATTTSNNVNGIYDRGRITIGSHFGTKDGSNNIVVYAGYTAATTAGGGSLSVVNQLTGGGTMGANLSSYSLRIANGGDSDVLDLGTNRSLLLSNNGTFLYAGGFNNDYTINGTGTSSLGSNSSNQPFIINTYTGTTLTVNTRTSSNFAPVSKAGAGTLVLGGDNNAVSTIYVQEGVLRVTNSLGLGNTTNGTNVQGGAALELASNIAIGAEALDLNGVGISNGGALRNLSGSNSWAGAITIGASGARINADASSSLTLTGGIATTVTQDVTFGGAGNTSVSTTDISGSGSLIKDGAGTLTLSSGTTHSYTGATTVTDGTLIVDGNISTSILTTVGTGATLGGSGTVGSLTIDFGGIFAPGNSPGITNVNGAYIQNGTLTAEVTGLTAGIGGHDQVNVTGAVTLNGVLSLTFNTFTPINGDLIFIMLNDGSDAITGTFTGLAQGDVAATYGGFNWQISYNADSVADTFTGTPNGNDIALMAVAIPEPSVALLGALGMLALLRRRR